jgi:hypothetical protein
MLSQVVYQHISKRRSLVTCRMRAEDPIFGKAELAKKSF